MKKPIDVYRSEQMLIDTLAWIADIADANYEQDGKLRAAGARTLKRISDKAREAIAKAEGRT